MPLVSVILPTYNRAEVVLRAVRTVRSQTATDLELVIVDDGSTDDTLAVLATVDDPRVRLLPSSHVGVSRARNQALAVSRGRWIAFLDDDDEWPPTYLETQLAAAHAHPEAVAVYCLTRHFDDHEGRFGDETPWYSFSGDLFAPMMQRGYPRPSATLVLRSVLVAVGGFAPDLDVASDCELLLRIALRGSYAYNSRALVIRHLHGRNQLSTQWERQRDSYWIQASHLRRDIVQRGGYRAWATWLRWHVGEAELAAISTASNAEQGTAAWAAVRRLARALPWSASAMVRPFVIAAFGIRVRRALRRWKGVVHRALGAAARADRRDQVSSGDAPYGS